MAHSTTPCTVLPHGGHEPRIDSSAFVAPTATVVGDAELGPEGLPSYSDAMGQSVTDLVVPSARPSGQEQLKTIRPMKNQPIQGHH